MAMHINLPTRIIIYTCRSNENYSRFNWNKHITRTYPGLCTHQCESPPSPLPRVLSSSNPRNLSPYWTPKTRKNKNLKSKNQPEKAKICFTHPPKPSLFTWTRRERWEAKPEKASNHNKRHREREWKIINSRAVMMKLFIWNLHRSFTHSLSAGGWVTYISGWMTGWSGFVPRAWDFPLINALPCWLPPVSVAVPKFCTATARYWISDTCTEHVTSSDIDKLVS